MSKKTEIKVYLPSFLVGRLEEKKKAGVRSKFIENAITQRLKGEQEFDIWDIPDSDVIDEAISRLRRLYNEDFRFALDDFLRRVYQ